MIITEYFFAFFYNETTKRYQTGKGAKLWDTRYNAKKRTG